MIGPCEEPGTDIRGKFPGKFQVWIMYARIMFSAPTVFFADIPGEDFFFAA